MTCDVKKNSLDKLKKRNVIDDVRFIIGNDLENFKKENTELTKNVSKIYGLETNGELMYKVETVSKTYGKDVIDRRLQTKYIATPNDVLFDELQQLFDIKHAVREDQLAIVTNRNPELFNGFSGYRYNDSGFFHYSLNSELVGNNGKRVLISNDGFLIQKKDKFLFDNLVKDFEGLTGYEFKIDDLTAYGKEMHIKFFDFVSREGLKGLEIVDSKGSTHFIKFENDIEVLETEEEIDELVDDVSLPINKSSLESKGWYDNIDTDRIYESYTPEEVNQLIQEDETKAIKTFNNLLYPDEFNNDIFVDSRSVNDQIRKCK